MCMGQTMITPRESAEKIHKNCVRDDVCPNLDLEGWYEEKDNLLSIFESEIQAAYDEGKKDGANEAWVGSSKLALTYRKKKRSITGLFRIALSQNLRSQVVKK